MPAYSFMQRFSPFVIDGSKPHTIRARRKHPAKQGDTLYLYEAMRTKWCKKLREEICTAAPTIIIDNDQEVYILDRRLEDHEIELKGDQLIVDVLAVEMHHAKLSAYDKDVLAWKDGFRNSESSKGCFETMYRFWSQTHHLPFVGDIIYWDPQPLPGKPFWKESLRAFNTSLKKHLL